MNELIPGLYEQIINDELNRLINAERSNRQKIIKQERIDNAEAPDVLSRYIAEIIKTALSRINSDDDVAKKVEFTNKLITTIKDLTEDGDFNELLITQSREQLLMSVENYINNATSINDQIETPRPETSLITSSLFTGANNEPQMLSELKKEIQTSDRIDMLVSFVKWSGLALVYDELKEFTNKGGKLRVITTSYLGATDYKAVDYLSKLTNTEIKVSYDTERTRLHAKAYMFYRNTGFNTAYVGSSNLSKPAISSGLEWNLKITSKDQQHILEKISATFENYWNNKDFHSFSADSEESKHRLSEALSYERRETQDSHYFYDIQPFPYQQEILDKLEAERLYRDNYKNLIVAATGTGKTVISAFDYKRFCNAFPQNHRLLFIAHRKEILKQSLECFRGILRDNNFGDLLYSGATPRSLDYLFLSIDSFNSKEIFNKTSPDFYDYIIVDEFHHAAAPTYQKLLQYYKPKVLLGLTATPERMDGQDILVYFDNKISAEIRLPEAIDKKLLCPFHYFGITDEVDLESIRWRRGGYDTTELSNVYTSNDSRVRLIAEQLDKYVTDMNVVKGLGFCVSQEHAQFMANKFNERSIPSIALTSNSRSEERESAKSHLRNGDIKFIFTVDLYNEGVDIPEVNTILFLRPTESLTVFLQQLGRGLRLYEGKDCLTVLDFIGRANKKYNFESKYSALLENTKHSVSEEIKRGFPFLPRGCYINLESVAQGYILDNIKQSIGSRNAIVSKLSTFKEDSGLELTLSNFIKYYKLDISDIYSRSNFARLCVNAGVKEDFNEDTEDIVTGALPRLASIDSPRILSFALKYLSQINKMSMNNFNESEKLMLKMLRFTIWQTEADDDQTLDGFNHLVNSPVMLDEILTLFKYKLDNIDFISVPYKQDSTIPLDVYCSYTRDQILIALGIRPGTLREGVRYHRELNTDLLFITLNKSDKDYSPTTMYNDYSINETLFHWQSQSTTSDSSPTGLRYKSGTSDIMIFVRETKKNRLGTAPYIFLGLADFVESSGSKPMNIIWKLRNPIPAKYIGKTSQMMIG